MRVFPFPADDTDRMAIRIGELLTERNTEKKRADRLLARLTKDRLILLTEDFLK